MLRRLLISATYLSLVILSPGPRSLAQKAPSPTFPVIEELQIYEQTKKTLQFFEQDTLQRQKLIAGKLVGRACDPTQGTCDKSGRVTQEVVELAFHGSLVGVRGELEVVESAHQARSKRNASTRCTDECRIFYEAAVDGAKSYWPGQSWLGIAMNVLFVSAKTVNDKQEAAREKFKEELGKKENLTSEQSDAGAALNEFDLKQGQERKEVFSKIAPEFRNYVLRLSEDRMKLIQQLWHVYDLAEENHDKENTDLVKRALQEWDKGTLELSGQLYFGFYAKAGGEPKDEWCKKRTEPDIEPADSPAPCNTLLTDLMRQRSVASLRPPKESFAVDKVVECFKIGVRVTPTEIVIGETAQASAYGLPEGCHQPDGVAYRYFVPPPASTNPIYAKGPNLSAVSVDETSGKVTGLYLGRALIYAGSDQMSIGGDPYPASIEVISKHRCSPVKVTVKPESILLGETAQANVSYAPEDCDKDAPEVPNLSYFSSNEQYAAVDERSGRVTGLLPGTVEIGAARSGLPGARLTILAPACDGVDVKYAEAGVAVGTTIKPKFTYLPEHCAIAGALVYAGSPKTIGKVDEATGEVTGIAPGDFTVIVSHETVKPTAGVIHVPVLPLNCTELRLSYAVANIYVGEDSPPAILSFLPEGCTPADEFIGFDEKGSHVDVQVDLSSGVVTGKAPGRASIRAYQGTWDKPRLEASTTIDVLRGPCTGLALSYEPQEIELGRIVKHKLVYTPNFCHKPDGDVEYSVSPTGALDMDFPGDFKGKRLGNAVVTATQGSSASEQTLRADSSILVMGGSDCKAVSLYYPSHDEEWTLHPNLVYDTITCVPPKPIVYRSSDPQIAAVDKTTGMVKGLAGGKVTISLDEGPPEGPRLHAEAEIEVPRWPECESYSLKVKTLTVPVGSRFKMPLPDSYPRFSRIGCQRGQMDITVDQPNVVNVEDPLIIRAVGKGKATITLHIDKWEDSFTVEVK